MKTIADCLGNQFKVHNFCVIVTVDDVWSSKSKEALLATVFVDIPINFQACNVSKGTQSLKLGKACGIDDDPNECF